MNKKYIAEENLIKMSYTAVKAITLHAILLQTAIA